MFGFDTSRIVLLAHSWMEMSRCGAGPVGARLASGQRDHGAGRGRKARYLVGRVGGSLHRWPVGISSDVKQSARCGSNQVVGQATAPRSLLPEGSHGDVHNAAVHSLQIFVAESERSHRARGGRLHDYVGRCRQASQDSGAVDG